MEKAKYLKKKTAKMADASCEAKTSKKNKSKSTSETNANDNKNNKNNQLDKGEVYFICYK